MMKKIFRNITIIVSYSFIALYTIYLGTGFVDSIKWCSKNHLAIKPADVTWSILFIGLPIIGFILLNIYLWVKWKKED